LKKIPVAGNSYQKNDAAKVVPWATPMGKVFFAGRRRQGWANDGSGAAIGSSFAQASGPRCGMEADTSKALAAFGFLTVLHSPEHGWFGGYLVLSPQGRPLEFRCSTPVAPTRAQEILYGPTLRPYLFAEVIGQSLVAGSELPVELILTDEPDVLPLALQRPEEIALVQPTEATGQNEADADANRIACFNLAGFRITVAGAAMHKAAWIEEKLNALAAHVVLIEPFDRIRAALKEAQTEHANEPECGHECDAA
jgi:hypothetical protein